jgi:hypothetical protein
MDLPILFWHLFMWLSSHAAVAAVTVEDGITTVKSLPLHRHCNRCLRPCHHPVCWRGPCPLPLTGWLTGRWNPRTLMTLCGVSGWCHVPSTVGLALTRLHRPKQLRHQVIRGRREEKKLTSVESR